MICEIISIGQELMVGEIVNTNFSYLASRLPSVGIDVRYGTSLGDYPDDLKEVLSLAVKRANIIFITGGLGPTEDDLTRKIISEFCNAPLRFHEDLLDKIREIFTKRNVVMAENNKIQAMIPEGAEVISNATGTATGFSINYKGVNIIALPGVPSEMKKMFEEEIYVKLEKKKTEENIIVTKLLNCFGMAEATVGEKIAHLMDTKRNPFVGTRVRHGIITLRIFGKCLAGEDIISSTEKEIREILGDVIFGEGQEMPEHAVAKELARLNKTLSVAESCTGGLISHRLTNVSGISQYFLEGVVSYSNEAKMKILGVPEEILREHGAVSGPVAEAMALGVKRISGSDYSAAVTGIAGPTGGTPEKPVGLVYIAVASPDTVNVQKCQFSGSREDIKERSVNTALNMLRLLLKKE